MLALEENSLRDIMAWYVECENLYNYLLNMATWLPYSARGIEEAELSYFAARKDINKLSYNL